MSKIQEENWELMSVLQMPWSEVKALSKSDKAFLLDKASEVKAEIIKHQKAQQEAMEKHQREQEQRQAEMQSYLAPPEA